MATGRELGLEGLSPSGAVFEGYNETYSSGTCGQYGQYSWQSWTYNSLIYSDPNGVIHNFNASGSYVSSTGSPPTCPQTGATPPQVLTTSAEDDSGITATFYTNSSGFFASLSTKSGDSISPPIMVNYSLSGNITTTDSNGNQITGINGLYTDTLGQSALLVQSTPPTTTLKYYNAQGTYVSYLVSYKAYSIKTNFSCSGISEYQSSGTVNLVDKITRPDGTYYQFSYEPSPGNSGYYTGRPASIVLPTGGTISYAYLGSNSGIECVDGSAVELERTTPDGTWYYARSGSGTKWTTTVTAPSYAGVQDQTVYEFLTDANSNFYEIERQSYAGSSSSGTLLQTVLHCYELLQSNCSTTIGDTGSSVTSPFHNLWTTVQWPNSAGISSGLYDNYDAVGNLTTHTIYDFGSKGSGTYSSSALQTTAIGYWTNPSESAETSNPSEVQVRDGSNNVVSDTLYHYDETAATSTSGTPQHVAPPYGQPGNLTSVKRLVSSTYQTSTYTNFDTGNVNVATDVNGAQTTFTYGACGNSFQTSVSKQTGGGVISSLQTGATWNCSGGVLLTSVDVSNNTTTYGFGNDPYWRPASIENNATGAVTSYTYPTPSLNNTISTMSFNQGASTSTSATGYDSLGRVVLKQAQQGPDSPSYDTVAISYDSRSRVASQTLPYSGTLNDYVPSNPGISTSYDALGRTSSVAGGGSGTKQYSYTANDVLITIAPQVTVPSAENLKKRNLEYNGAGWLKSVCEVVTSTLPAGGSCGQSSVFTGYLSKYSYDGAGRLTQAQQNAQPGSGGIQTRTLGYDGLGRKTSELIPEWSAGTGIAGTGTYTYDSDPTGTCSGTFPGDLIKSVDSMGDATCYTYDLLHRKLSSKVVSGNYAGVTPQAYYVYDAATYNGIAMQNALGALAEAYTCNGSCAPNKQTDMFFSTSPVTSGVMSGGVQSQMWESTPNSNGYFLTADTYYPNGTLGSISVSRSGGTIGVPFIAYGVDGEGRPSTAEADLSVPSGYTYCAPENGTCSFAGSATIGYGANGLFYYQNLTGGASCSNSVFGDPDPGYVKACYYSESGSGNPVAPEGYVYCANENGACSYSGSATVAYGVDGQFFYKTFTGGTPCNVSVFGDPAYGYAKACFYSMSGTGAATLVTSTAYNPAGSATTISYGNASSGLANDVDSFTYDPSTNRPTNLTYSVSPSSGTYTVSTALTWNSNGSLQRMLYTDGSPNPMSQNCAYSADDLSRISLVDCGSSAWGQTFTYDPMGNINKEVGSGRTGTTYSAGYSPVTNQVSSGISPNPTYDKNGNQLTSTPTTLSWNAWNVPISIGGTSATYDALGRLVETGSGTTYKQFVYRPSGSSVAVYSGGLIKGTIPLPGGSTAIYNGSGLSYIRHTDWLGSSRFATTWAHTVYSKEAYAPFGETYNESGTPDRSFTGQDQDVVTGSGGTGVYDFLFRKYDSSSGRWLSPDPDGWKVVDISDPQSLDRYSYVTNRPMSAIDPSGLACVYIDNSGMVSVSNEGSDSMASGVCNAYGGVYVDGFVDPNAVGPIPGQSNYNLGDGTVSFTYGSGNADVVFGGQTYPGSLSSALWMNSAYQFSGFNSLWTATLPVDGVPVPVASAGVNLSVTYIPETNTWCVGPSLAIATGAGKSFSLTMFGSYDAQHSKDVMNQYGWVLSGQASELVGVSVASNSSGALTGYTIATDSGVSGSYGYNFCADF